MGRSKHGADTSLVPLTREYQAAIMSYVERRGAVRRGLGETSQSAKAAGKTQGKKGERESIPTSRRRRGRRVRRRLRTNRDEEDAVKRMELVQGRIEIPRIPDPYRRSDGYK